MSATKHTELSEKELQSYPYRELMFVEPVLELDERKDGSTILRSGIPMKPMAPSIPHLFKQQALRFPDRTWLAQKDAAGEWQRLSYSEFDDQSDAVAQWMLDHGFGQATPLMVLSENSLAHALMIMGAMKARVPVSSISAPYSLMDKSLSKLKLVSDVLQPSIVFAQCGERYKSALGMLEQPERVLICAENPSALAPENENRVLSLSELLATSVQSVNDSIEKIDHETVAKAMFTSGSTGTPKCVIQTQGVLCAQVAGLDSIWECPDPQNYAPTSLQWMPWSHVSAGNISYHEAILKGGAIYIDDGKPIAGLFEKTIENLRGLPTSVFGSAPLGLSWLATALEGDAELAATFFQKLEAIAYGGSALPQDIATRIQRLAVANTGHRVPIISMYGSTETQGITATHWATEIPGVIGLPVPGTEIKLVPNASKLEVRVKGGTVMREYLDAPELSRDSFDEEGYFKLGDAARYADPADPKLGLVFDGRISEDFKLLSGTWVSTVAIKSQMLKFMGSLIRDAVIVGENQMYVSALVWLDKQAAKAFVSSDVDADDLADDAELLKELGDRLQGYNQEGHGSSRKVVSMVMLRADASMAEAEVNEKGYINTKVLAANRAQVINAVYALNHQGVIGERALLEQ